MLKSNDRQENDRTGLRVRWPWIVTGTEHACVGGHNYKAKVLLTKLIQERQNVAISPIQMVASAHKRIVKKLDLGTHQKDKE